MKLLIAILFSFSVFAQTFDLESFVSELGSRQARVEEFRHIKKIASKLGIKHVYMFGGTAAAWGHYVRWDMRRELGIEKLQSHRFDYDYTNIFRSNQDFDVVIEGTIEQAETLEAAVQKKFNYFSGSRPTWEVRLLNEKRHDKDSILGDDFQNQHTDSHSTGLIEMMDCHGLECVKDVRDMNNNKPAFLRDLFEAKLHYYYSKNHQHTLRFKNGLNPPILSVIRYFTKAVQYQLEIRAEDLNTINSIIKNFNPLKVSKWDSYVDRWLEKNAKKLIVNASDMQFAQELIESSGLKDKLIQLGDPTVEGSMAWWLNKEALKGFELGQGDGKTAKQIFSADNLGNIILAHETNSFAAFESITKAHDGSANVLISRSGVSGEMAIYGDGHYTKIGREGARGTGLTIRYKLHPLAKEGSDFVIKDDFIIIKNRNAVEVIYESIDLTPSEYFDRIVGGLDFDFNDQGVVEKLKRRIARQVKNLSKEELFKIIENLGAPSDYDLDIQNRVLMALKETGALSYYIQKHSDFFKTIVFEHFKSLKKSYTSVHETKLNIIRDYVFSANDFLSQKDIEKIHKAVFKSRKSIQRVPVFNDNTNLIKDWNQLLSMNPKMLKDGLARFQKEIGISNRVISEKVKQNQEFQGKKNYRRGYAYRLGALALSIAASVYGLQPDVVHTFHGSIMAGLGLMGVVGTSIITLAYHFDLVQYHRFEKPARIKAFKDIVKQLKPFLIKENGEQIIFNSKKMRSKAVSALRNEGVFTLKIPKFKTIELQVQYLNSKLDIRLVPVSERAYPLSTYLKELENLAELRSCNQLYKN